jgi:hypothetical protein
MKTTLKENSKNSKNSKINKKIFSNRWEKSINAFIMDEGHKYRYSDTKIVIMIKDFRARTH